MTTALVLGGGGIVGIAWQIGVLAGLDEHGLSLADADLVIGTSAGATVGARLAAGATPASLYTEQLGGRADQEDPQPTTLGDVMGAIRNVTRGLREPAEIRRSIGQYALNGGADAAGRLASITRRLHGADWPHGRHLRVAAVEVESGGLVLFDGGSGVRLVDAVAASSAVPGMWPPVRIGHRYYMDGGVRSFTNADAAQGHDIVVVIEPMTARESSDVRRLEASWTCLIAPAPEVGGAMQRQMFDSRSVPRIAEAGFEQVDDQLVTRLSHLWGRGE